MGDYQPCIPGQAQPVPRIRNRPEICGGHSHGAEAVTSDTALDGNQTDGSAAGQAFSGVKSDKDLQLMDYFLGTGK